MQMLDEAVQAAAPTEGPDEDWEPVRLDINVDAYVPADYIPYEQAKVDVHRRIAGAREVADLDCCARNCSTASATCRSRSQNLLSMQIARIKLGQAGASAVTFKGGRLAVTPIELDSVRRQAGPERSFPRRCTSRASRSSRCGCPTIRQAVSRLSCAPPTCSCPSSARPRRGGRGGGRSVGSVRRRSLGSEKRSQVGADAVPVVLEAEVANPEDSGSRAAAARCPWRCRGRGP